MNTTWTMTLKTGVSTWTTTTIEASNHVEAGHIAQRLVGPFPITRIV